MLSTKNYVLLGFQAAVAIGLLSGCVITSSPTGGSSGGGGGGSGGSGGSDATVTSTVGATTTTTTGVGGGTTTTSGTGGTACVGETGTAMVADCEKINIAPAAGASSSCGPNLNEAPPGYGLCKRGFDLFNPGAATNLVSCLGKIGVQDECKTDPLQACVDGMFADECVIASIATSCGGIKMTCGNDPFDAAKCATDLNPFSDAGLTELSTCINSADPTLTCQAAYDKCYTEVLTF